MTMRQGLRQYLQVESIIAIPSSDPRTSKLRLAEARSEGAEIFEYSSRKHLEEMVRSERLTHNYVFSAGGTSGISYCTRDQPHWRLLDTTHITRAVFRGYKPHGDYYLYVSEWLYDWSKKFPWTLISPTPKGTFVSWLPHAVSPLVGDGPGFKMKNGIPSNAKLIGRIGGYEQFNDPAARGAVLNILDAHKDVWFAAVNTEFFGSHERLVYIPEINRKLVWDFYEACDILLNGRLSGESFGFSIVEPLSVGKPVLAPSRRRNFSMDLHQEMVLRDTGLLYDSQSDLLAKLNGLIVNEPDLTILNERVRQFELEQVISRFETILNSSS
jgi:hypothetical protein